MRKGSTVRRRALGVELRGKREAAGLSAGEVVERLRWSPSRLSKLEHGERGSADVDVAALLAVCGVADEEFDRLVGLCQESDRDVWVQPFGDGRVLANEEARAAGMVGYQPMAVSGLLNVELSAERREVPGRAGFYVGEEALRRAGSEQLLHLLLVPAEVRVVPGQACVNGPFTLLGDAVVHLETLVADIYLERPDHVAAYRATVGRLSEVAWDVRRSREVLATA
ncbi:Scr1 family TA system antitoxin-like transcriptional regulator [Umezawaea sp. Da 62-37]|uniref:Scr1 family TA system antitoxin-like transcriptional regulator n=1 Tax=Umezawaea sp. Da 62-37 TaxID=3075927 RepID=UPI0028F72B36|nr:Scr1 family TA system antitoxin-like transcriptional regulator [Umezawaea sp. Da 62-37]WNV84162.1 Scr1 family TA system antitoxin-like transcriptional regulator [Umezawaea sp. Da 62-37]